MVEGGPKNTSSLLFAANTSWYLLNFRKHTILKAIESGHKVYCLYFDKEYTEELEGLGARCLSMEKPTGGIKLKLWWASTLIRIARTVRKTQPQMVFSFTTAMNFLITPVVFSSNALCVVTVSGLGLISSWSPEFRSKYLFLYGFWMKMVDHVVFQNPEDQRLISEIGKLSVDKQSLILGSGVSLSEFESTPIPESSDLIIGFFSRLVRQKGLLELVEAVKRSTLPKVKIVVAGSLLGESTSGISKREIDSWQKLGLVDFLGEVKDVRPLINKCHVVALPSYYGEGVPKILIEAASSGRPIITTDHPGCRLTVSHESGLLVEPKSVESLVTALSQFYVLSHSERQKMGNAARRLAESKFDVEQNTAHYMSLVYLLDTT